MSTSKTTGKASRKTSISDLGTDLASAYEDRMAVRVERAALLPDVGVPVALQPVVGLPASLGGSSPELVSLAGRYLNADSLSEEDVENVRSLAASVLSQRTTD